MNQAVKEALASVDGDAPTSVAHVMRPADGGYVRTGVVTFTPDADPTARLQAMFIAGARVGGMAVFLVE